MQINVVSNSVGIERETWSIDFFFHGSTMNKQFGPRERQPKAKLSHIPRHSLFILQQQYIQFRLTNHWIFIRQGHESLFFLIFSFHFCFPPESYMLVSQMINSTVEIKLRRNKNFHNHSQKRRIPWNEEEQSVGQCDFDHSILAKSSFADSKFAKIIGNSKST